MFKLQAKILKECYNDRIGLNLSYHLPELSRNIILKYDVLLFSFHSTDDMKACQFSSDCKPSNQTWSSSLLLSQ